MEIKLDKLNKVYDYLRSSGKVHTKKEFAEHIEFDRTNLSSAFNGDERYLTDGLFKKICEKFPEIFNIEYFLKDEGEMLKNNQQIGDISNSTVVGANISGNGITISHNDFQILTEMVELQKGYQEMIQTK